MDHLLDNPVWNALLTGNKNVAEGNDRVKCFPASIAPFTGLKEINQNGFNALYELIPAKRTIALVSPGDITVTNQWTVKNKVKVFQMLNGNNGPAETNHHEILPLQVKHIPQMLALTRLTNPGPFHERTIELGNYYGIFCNEQLVAMAGQRMHAGQYLEISAVCTEPGYHGKGYATLLMRHMTAIIKAQMRTPFLHVLTENARAIKLYESLGFVTRREMLVYVLQKKDR